MRLQDFVVKIRKALEQTLPGMEAQKVLAPEVDIDKRFIKDLALQARQGAVMILLYEQEGEVYFPLIQRPQYIGAHSGQVSLPGGKMEAKDINLIQTALRETEEEIGVPMNSIEVLGEISQLFVPASNFNIQPVIGYLNKPPVYKIDPHEVQKLIIANAKDLLNHVDVKKTVVPAANGVKLTAPYFDIEGHVVWGATAMILSEFSWLLKSN